MSITKQHTQESLCIAHIYALAGSAGLNYGIKYEYDYGVDGSFQPVAFVPDSKKASGFRLANTGFPLDFQAKSSYDWELTDGHIVYDLEGKNFNDIVQREAAAATLILILLCLPKEVEEWHKTEEDATTLRTCCYWHVFSGDPVNSNSKKRIRIPVSQRLTPAVLRGLVDQERARRRTQSA